MNRQQRRQAQRDGDGTVEDAAVDEAALESAAIADAPPEDAPREDAGRASGPAGAPGVVPRRRTTPRVFVHEVNVEMRKVAWPTRSETINYASVVLVTLIVLMGLILGLDTGFQIVAQHLFK